MLRVAIISTLLFFSVSAGLLYYHWERYDAAEQPTLRHEIEASVDGATLFVSHRISGTVKQSYVIKNMKRTLKVTCANGKRCVTYDRRGQAIVNVPSEGALSLSYRLPLEKKEAFVISSPFLSLQTDQPQHMTIQLTDRTQKGMWIADADAIGQADKRAFSFYMWEKKDGEPVSLYFQKQPLQRFVADRLHAYASKKPNRSLLSVWQKHDVHTLVVTSYPLRHVTPTFVVMNERADVASIERAYIRKTLQARFPNSELDDWIWDLLVSYVMKQQPVTEKAKIVWQQLKQTLNDEQFSLFWKTIERSDGKPLTAKSLDEALGDAYGGKTAFFSGDGKSLTFTSGKTLVVNGTKLPTAHVVLKNGEQLFPFVPVMRTLGYAVNRSGDAVFIEKEGQRWRFFVGNEQNIIREWNGALYIEKTQFTDWFPLFISETESEVNVIGQ